MAQVSNNEDRFGGEYMVQDRDHMSEDPQATGKAHRGSARQPQQSQTDAPQQGSGDQHASKQQGGERGGKHTRQHH